MPNTTVIVMTPPPTKRIFGLLGLLTLTACTYQSNTLEGLRCDRDGQRNGDQICRRGVWSTADGPDVEMTRDLSEDLSVDLPTMDMNIKDMAGDIPTDLAMDMSQDMPADTSKDITIDMPQNVCGDGVIGPNEQCDDGNLNPIDGCNAQCKRTSGWLCPTANQPCSPECGDGQVLGDEQCDDRNTNNMDGCSSTCQIEPGWLCPAPHTQCAPECGDGRIIDTEQCDDRNTNNMDGCSATCQIEGGWSCAGQPSQCKTTSTVGNGQLDQGERCDDGNAFAMDGCDAQGQIEPGYICPALNTPCQRVTSVSEGTVTPLPGATGGGGGAFTDNCPTGSYIVGIRGYEHDLSVLNGGNPGNAALARTRFICAAANIDQQGLLSWSTSTSTTWRGTQQRNDLGQSVCRQDEFVAGYAIRYDSLIRGVRLRCASFNIKDGQLQRGTIRALALYGYNQGTQTQRETLCAQDQLINGVDGNSGWLIDSLSFQCHQIVLAP